MIFLSDDRRNARPAGLICIAVLTVRFTTPVHITTAANLKPKECWIKPVPIFVIFSNLNKQENLPYRLIRELKTSWKSCLRKADSNVMSLRGNVTTEAIS